MDKEILLRNGDIKLSRFARGGMDVWARDDDGMVLLLHFTDQELVEIAQLAMPITKACNTLGELGPLMQPALEALPLEGHEWHTLTVHVKRNADGTIGVRQMRLQNEREC